MYLVAKIGGIMKLNWSVKAEKEKSAALVTAK